VFGLNLHLFYLKAFSSSDSTSNIRYN